MGVCWVEGELVGGREPEVEDVVKELMVYSVGSGAKEKTLCRTRQGGK